MSKSLGIGCVVLTMAGTAGAEAPPKEWPLPWPTSSEVELPAERELPEGSPFLGVCERLERELRAAESLMAAEVGCSVYKRYEGAGPIRGAATLRLVGDDLGITDVWFLAVETSSGWHLGPVLGDGSYTGVGGWSQGVTVDDIVVTLLDGAAVVVARARGFMEDTDLGVNAQTEEYSASVSVCLVTDSPAGAPACARALTHRRRTLSKASDEEKQVPPRESYGPLGTRDWSRPLTWDPKAGAFKVGPEKGKRPQGQTIPALPKRATAAAVVEAYAARAEKP
ncbi:MAG: hypothetical protein IV100_00800 [Myxococcales bacterium]|nr:hypothetical protein [Myxococcales bacterium]